ncbi:MAG: TRAP transporter substrate-binding protein [Treponema sp.]|jgi:tripartite ATP-independent transporter DctP family solute receptor|nr:TRAP transporter substrate-binding protein [Treponema sp.]
MKKIFTVLLGIVLAASVFAGGGQQSSGGGGSQQPITLRYAELNPDGHIMDLCADHFAELVKQKSGGRITIQVFPAGQLGDEKTVYQGLQIGSVDMCRGNTNSMVDFGVKKLTLFGLPFIFRDRDHLWKVLNSEIGEEFLKEMQDIGTGMVGLFYLDEGSRNFFTAKRYVINSINDYRGLKLRVPTTELMSDTVAAMGVQSTPISFSELYSALQTGVVDGAEQPHSGYFSNKFYEVAPNYILSGHTYSPGIVLASEISWKKLSPADQALIREAAKETEAWNKSNIEKLDNDLLVQIKAAGANVIPVPDKTPYIERTRDVSAKYSKGLESYYQAILSK